MTSQHGDAREESFYPARRDLLLQAAQAAGKPQIDATMLPKPTDAGNPDFRLWNGSDRIAGYVKTSTPTAASSPRCGSRWTFKRKLIRSMPPRIK